jgi:hypothetical protein
MIAELVADNLARCAGITAPVPELCRALLEAGHNPATRLMVYRGSTLELVVRSIAEVAEVKLARSGVPVEAGAVVVPFTRCIGADRRGANGGDSA